MEGQEESFKKNPTRNRLKCGAGGANVRRTVNEKS